MRLISKKNIAREFLIIISVVVLGLFFFLSSYLYNYYQHYHINKINESIYEKQKISDSLAYSFKNKTGKQNWLFNKYIESNAAYKLWEHLNLSHNIEIIELSTQTFGEFVDKYNYNINKRQYYMWDLLYSEKMYTKNFPEFQDQFFPIGKPFFPLGLSSKESLWLHLTNLCSNDSIIIRYANSWYEKDMLRFKKIGIQSGSELSDFIEQNCISEIDISNLEKADSIDKEKLKMNWELIKYKNKVLTYREQIEFGIKSFIAFALICFPLRYLFYLIKWSIRTLRQ